MKNIFRIMANHVSRAAGSPLGFIIAFLLIVVWALTGPIFDYSTTWQLIVNTGTTILTFLMVFLIQNTQNRDAHAIHLKLDEIIHALRGARDELINVEDDTDDKINSLQKEFNEIKKIHHENTEQH